jgi:hypothetical protein
LRKITPLRHHLGYHTKRHPASRAKLDIFRNLLLAAARTVHLSAPNEKIRKDRKPNEFLHEKVLIAKEPAA